MTGSGDAPSPARRSVVVTGVGRAGQLGETIARAFGQQGARVSIVARTAADANARAAALRAEGFDVHPFVADLADPVATAALAVQVIASAGRVDALVNAAGGFALSGPVAESDPALLAQQIAINLSTAYATTRAFLPALRASAGAVVFVASSSALPGARVKNASAYAIAKTGVLTLMRAVAQEERGHGVRSNAVAPGSIRTHDNLDSMPNDCKFVERESVAATILFLCSPAAAQVSGEVIELTP